AMKTDLELALESAINIYHRYAIRNPMDDYLSRNEFATLLKENAKPFLKDTYIKQLFAKSDSNHDGRLKFTEFLTTLSLVAIDAHNRSHGLSPPAPRAPCTAVLGPCTPHLSTGRPGQPLLPRSGISRCC
uniref:EF-hand domain-containing protein n=1 Tax=Pavo cristatus TaxID=9049 RepID=A0A8C9FG83_PAVCR